ncbi:MAG: peptidylprolyl isomerase [Chthoniobacterales bacterium]
MKLFRSTLRPVALLIAAAFSAQALIVKPNVAPVVTNTIGNYDQLLETTRVIDLTGFFKDPDASAAVQLITPLGTMNLTLDGETAPITVANLLNYLNSGRYFKADPNNGGQIASLFFHRSALLNGAPFVLQTGGWLGTIQSGGVGAIQPTQVLAYPAIMNEPVISNKRGTIAMAKTATDANSATSEFFINLADNGGGNANLDTTVGGFTVFGRVAGNGMTVADAIKALPTYNFGVPFNELPLRNYDGRSSVKLPNLVSIPTFAQISPLTFTASSTNSAVAPVSISGNNVLIGAKQIGTSNITVTATDLDGAAISQMFTVNVVSAPGRLLNLATRMNIGTGDNVLIAGFIMGGGTSKRLAVRAIGPSLQGIVPNVISDPRLELRDDTQALIASNDNWGDSPNKQDLIDFHLNPSSDKESALIATVPSSAGSKAYTAIVQGVGGATGVGLVEVYDLDAQAGSTLLNFSSRGRVGSADSDAMFGGVIIGGNQSVRLVVRARGPSLTNFGIAGVLADPTLEVRDANGTLLDSNDDWQSNPNAAEIQNDHLQPDDPKEPAVIITLAPAAYTAIVHGKGGTTGVATVEAYQVN